MMKRQSLGRCGVALTLAIALCGAASAQSKPGGALSGRVLLEDGQPATRASVKIRLRGARGDSQEVECDENGAFKISDLAAGSYSVSASAPGYVSIDDGNRVYRPGETATLRLVKGGVITGRATDSSGEALIDVSIDVQRVRDLNGQRSSDGENSDWDDGAQTDDRGIYRAFGLRPGVYIVSVESSASGRWYWGQRNSEVPTYYPATTRDAAMEITVRPGDEITNIDIRHRGDTGYAVSGIVSGATESSDPFSSPGLTLVNAVTKEAVSSTSPNQSKGFVFFGVPNGEYELYARMRASKDEYGAGSPPQRVSVKSADVTGLSLRMAAYAAISGRVIIEAPKPGEAKCKNASPSVEEILLNAQSDLRNQRTLNFVLGENDEARDRSAPNEKGEFTLAALEPDGYRIEANLPGENWFIRSITLPATGSAKTKTDAARSPINVKSGEKVSGVEITIAEGAASLSGRLEAKDTAKSPNRARVHLIPAEATAIDDVLRYRETVVEKNGSFDFKHIAPGKYRLLARSISETEKDNSRPAAFDSTERLKLKKEAEAAPNEFELTSCQRVTNHALKF